MDSNKYNTSDFLKISLLSLLIIISGINLFITTDLYSSIKNDNTKEDIVIEEVYTNNIGDYMFTTELNFKDRTIEIKSVVGLGKINYKINNIYIKETISDINNIVKNKNFPIDPSKQVDMLKEFDKIICSNLNAKNACTVFVYK